MQKKFRRFEIRKPSREFYLVLTLGLTFLTIFAVGFLYYQARLLKRIAAILQEVQPPREVEPPSIQPAEGASFTDLFSGTAWLNATGTTLYHDFAMTTLSFPPKFEWGKVPEEEARQIQERIAFVRLKEDGSDERCIGDKCLIQKGLKLFFVLSEAQGFENQKTALGAVFGEIQRSVKSFHLPTTESIANGDNLSSSVIGDNLNTVEVGGIAPPSLSLANGNSHYATPTANLAYQTGLNEARAVFLVLPVELQTPNLLNISIGSTDKFWLLGGVTRSHSERSEESRDPSPAAQNDTQQYRGYVYKFDPSTLQQSSGQASSGQAANFTRIFDDNDFLSPYPGVFGFGGTSDDWLAIYGAYEGIAWQVRANQKTAFKAVFGDIALGALDARLPTIYSIASTKNMSSPAVDNSNAVDPGGIEPPDVSLANEHPHQVGPTATLSYQTAQKDATALIFFHNISRFFPIRVMGNSVKLQEAKERFVSFRPEAIRDGKNWYVYSLTENKPKLIKLVENEEGAISAAWDLTKNLGLDQGIKSAVFSLEKPGSLLALIERQNKNTAVKGDVFVDFSIVREARIGTISNIAHLKNLSSSSVDKNELAEGFAPSKSRVPILGSYYTAGPRLAYQTPEKDATTTELWRFTDLGFDKSKPLEAMSLNINTLPGRVVSARISAIEPPSVIASPALAGRGNLVQFWLSNDGVFWKEAEPYKTVTFTDPQPKLFWRVKFVPDEDLMTSPVLDRLGLEWQWIKN